MPKPGTFHNRLSQSISLNFRCFVTSFLHKPLLHSLYSLGIFSNKQETLTLEYLVRAADDRGKKKKTTKNPKPKLNLIEQQAGRTQALIELQQNGRKQQAATFFPLLIESKKECKAYYPNMFDQSFTRLRFLLFLFLSQTSLKLTYLLCARSCSEQEVFGFRLSSFVYVLVDSKRS